MKKSKINRVVIVGGGTAGWITASLLVRLLGKSLSICLVESEQIGTVGVGEASIPPIQTLNQALGIDEAEFIRATNATIKLGIQFENWSKPGDSYMHAFGQFGKGISLCGFEQLWLRSALSGAGGDFWDYSLNYQAAKQSKFAKFDSIPNTGMGELVYAYHFDAGLYAKFLRDYAERSGVQRIEGLVESVQLDDLGGEIRSLTLQSGEYVEGDLFIDCSGFKGLLIGDALKVGYRDWSHLLPADSAVAVQTESAREAVPYTRSIAHAAGWQWQIPLQNRVGNGLVYSGASLSDEGAVECLLQNIDGNLKSEPRVIKFTTGRREQLWSKNCVSIGLASGFLEPLESTSIHMVQTAVTRLIKLFPHNGIKASEVAEYNRQTIDEMEHVRDFIILHYVLNEREEPFWQACKSMAIPDTLRHKIELFQESAKVFNSTDALFSDVAWQQVMIGQGVMPRDYHPIANSLSEQQLSEWLSNVKSLISQVTAKLPSHRSFINGL